MKNIGMFLKDYIESHHLVKADIAQRAGVTPNYLSNLFHKSSIDALLLEKLCLAMGVHPCAVFDIPGIGGKNFSDISANTTMGDATVQISQNESLKDDIIAEKERLIAEKERTIQLLINKYSGEPGQIRDNKNE